MTDLERVTGPKSASPEAGGPAQRTVRGRMPRRNTPVVTAASDVVLVCGLATAVDGGRRANRRSHRRADRDGHGPVINAGDRVEASASVLWPWLIAAASCRLMSRWLLVPIAERSRRWLRLQNRPRVGRVGAAYPRAPRTRRCAQQPRTSSGGRCLLGRRRRTGVAAFLGRRGLGAASRRPPAVAKRPTAHGPNSGGVAGMAAGLAAPVTASVGDGSSGSPPRAPRAPDPR